MLPVSRTALSTAEKNKINNDPAIQEIVSLFEGQISDIRRTDILSAGGDEEAPGEP